MKKKRIKNFNSIKTLIFLIIISFTLKNCSTTEKVETLKIKKSVAVVSYNDFLDTSIIKESNLKILDATNYNYFKSSNEEIKFKLLQNYVLTSKIKDQLTYSIPIEPLSYIDKKYLYYLIIEKNNKGLTKYILKTSTSGNKISLQKIADEKEKNVKTKNKTYNRNNNCTFITIESPPTCECGYYNNGNWVQVSTANPGGTITTMICPNQGQPIKATFHTSTTSQGSGGGGSVSSSAFGANPGPVYVYSSQEERCYPDGTCTPPLYIPTVSTLNDNPEVPSEEDNPLLGADCRSFEYAQPPGSLQRACGVKDFKHTFYSLEVTSDGRIKAYEVTSNFPIVYFTMPTGITNGQAANNTAKAITAAIRATDVYYGINPRASKEQVGDFFKQSIQTALAVYGGRMTPDAPFSIRSPAPYLTSLIGAKTDCN
ncbi:protein of unknown function [Tenacibaculum sp. 190524A02b]|uniref:hypothetical protein n=1 Tax=Tenacibaculum vairaonense TaxID=3137860 RepID=UPI0032B2BDD5